MVDLLNFTSNKKISSGVEALNYIKVYCQTLSINKYILLNYKRKTHLHVKGDHIA